MKFKIKAKSHGITRLNITNWSRPEIQALKALSKEFKFYKNFNFPEQLLRASHSIKHIAAMTTEKPNTKEKIAYIQEVLFAANHLTILLSMDRMGISIKDELIPWLEVEFDDLSELLHSLNSALWKAFKNLNKKTRKKLNKSTEEESSLRKKELRKLALEYLCRIFIIGSPLEPTLTTNSDSSKITGTLYQFLIKTKPFFEMNSGIKLGRDSSIGRDAFNARKAAQKFKKIKVKKQTKKFM
jgi:hypothetical protein